MQTDDRGVSLWCEETDEDYRDQAALGTGAPGGQLRAAWDPSVSGRRVIQRLLHVEERYAPSPLYVGLIQQEPQRREELAKWTLEVRRHAISLSTTGHLFLSVTLSTPVLPYCLAAACVLIASKLSECDNITSNALCAAAEYNFLPANLREMERVVLATLRWDTAAVTPQDFLPHFLASLGERNEEDSTTLRRHSDTLATLCACDSRFLGASPSLVAAASLNCAFRGLGNREHSRLHPLSSTLADLCQADPVVLQYYSEMIEHALRQRLSNRPADKGDEFEDERAGTPTDMREIDF
nr:cyclin Dx [Syngnathus scovelli]